LDNLKSLTFKSVFERTVARFPQRPALSFVGQKPITYAELNEKVQEVSKFLHNEGVASGDRVAILSQNMPNWGLAFLAITTMGAIAVPILPEFRPNQVHHILRHSGAKVIFVSKQLYERLENGEFNELTTVILIDDFTLIPLATNFDKLQEVLNSGRKEFARLKEIALKMTGMVRAEVQEDDLASIIYTSGTTGHSKGVMLTHKNLIFDAIATTKVQKIDENDCMLSILPLSHTIECTLGFTIPILQGSAVYYLDKPPVARILLPALAQVKPTLMLIVPLVIEKIFKLRILPKFTRSPLMRKLYKIPLVRKKLHKIAAKKLYQSFGGKLIFMGIGGAPLSPEVELFLREGKFPYSLGYGLTETSPLLTGTAPDITKLGSTGPALPGIEMKIDNPDPNNGEGEILACGPNVMQGYYKDPERTAEVFTDDGWFKTGDLGVIDKDGYVFIKGRSKNMLLGPNGENIYPEEIEASINQCAHVLESLVFQQHKKIIARIHLNYDELDDLFDSEKLTDSQIKRKIDQLLTDIQSQVNEIIPSFSRINKIIEQSEPFEKTPTLKIKRYLYLD